MSISPRPYQQQSVDAVFERFAAGDPSTLVILPTGTGKTVVFGLVCRKWSRDRFPGRVLVLAHRDELIQQAADELEGILGTAPAIEQAERFAVPAAGGLTDAPAVVVGSVQTLCRDRRLARWPRDEFGLIVTDEAHHATADSYTRIYRHFGSAKLLGVTATPKRADDLALGHVFGSVAFEMGIEDAVGEGWLCPVEQRYVTVRGLDLSRVATRGDDFADGQIGAVLSGDSVLDQMVAATVELCGDEPTLVFTAPRPPGEEVSQGDLFADALNAIRPGRAVFLSGETEKDTRRRELELFERGERQYLVGCSLFTEGFNVPKISRVVMARPTQSTAYYTQCIGRGTRTLRGVLTPDLDTPESRKHAVATSAKPSVLVIDFVGNSGRHKLVSAVDIFAGKHPSAVVERAKARAVATGVDVRAALDEAAKQMAEEKRQKEEAERRRKEKAAKARVKVNRVDLWQESVDPFGTTDTHGQRPKLGSSGRATGTQLDWIRSHGGFCTDTATAQEAGAVIADIKDRWAKRLCSPKQERTLRKRGMIDGPVSKDHAKALLDWLAARDWRPAERPTRKQLGIVRSEAGDGWRLTIDKVPVGAVFAGPEAVRAAYKGLVAEPVAA